MCPMTFRAISFILERSPVLEKLTLSTLLRGGSQFMNAQHLHFRTITLSFDPPEMFFVLCKGGKPKVEMKLCQFDRHQLQFQNTLRKWSSGVN